MKSPASTSTPSSADVPEEQDEVDADGPVDRAVVVDVAAHHGEVALTTPDGSTKLRPRNDTFKSPGRIVGLALNTEFFGDYVLFQCVGSVAGFSWTSMRSPGGAGGPGTALEAGADGNDGPGALLCVALASSFVMTSALVTQSSHWHRVWSVTPTSPSGQYILGDEPDQ